MSGDLQRDPLAGCVKDDATRSDGEPIEADLLGGIVASALLDPAKEYAVLPAVALQALDALVRKGQGRLLQDEAIAGCLAIDAQRLGVRERRVVRLEVIAEQGEPKAPLALKGAMAGPAVAPKSAKQRQNM